MAKTPEGVIFSWSCDELGLCLGSDWLFLTGISELHICRFKAKFSEGLTASFPSAHLPSCKPGFSQVQESEWLSGNWALLNIPDELADSSLSRYACDRSCDSWVKYFWHTQMWILVPVCTELAGASRGLLWTSEEKRWLHLVLKQIFRLLCTLLPVSSKKSKSLIVWSWNRALRRATQNLLSPNNPWSNFPLAGKQRRTAALMILSLLKPLGFKRFEDIEDEH